MIQFNLLPSVKLEYIKANRTKRLVIVVALITSAVALGVFIILFLNVNVAQTKHIANITTEIQENTAKLKEIEDVDKILTVQNQLNSLTALHEQKPAASRALNYLTQITPEQASISNSTIDLSNNTITINGTARSLVIANKFIDTIKFTKYTTDSSSEQLPAFTDVVLTSFSVTDDQVTYQIDLKYNPEIFDNTKKVSLVIPNIISTRSQTQKPSDDLFQPSPEADQGEDTSN